MNLFLHESVRGPEMPAPWDDCRDPLFGGRTCKAGEMVPTFRCPSCEALELTQLELFQYHGWAGITAQPYLHPYGWLTITPADAWEGCHAQLRAIGYRKGLENGVAPKKRPGLWYGHAVGDFQERNNLIISQIAGFCWGSKSTEVIIQGEGWCTYLPVSREHADSLTHLRRYNEKTGELTGPLLMFVRKTSEVLYTAHEWPLKLPAKKK